VANSNSAEWKAPKILPSIDLRTVKKINRILAERSDPKPKKNVVVPNIIINPLDLEPIHLRSDPLPPLSPTTELFCRENGARNIVKQRRRGQAKYAPQFRSQPTRNKNPLIDDSAVESDGEGGDIPSRATTPERSVPSSPARTTPPTPHQTEDTPSTNCTPLPVKKVKLKKPRPNSYCKECVLFFSGPKQLNVHEKSKKHLKQLRNGTSTHCTQCNRFFQSRHNLVNHKCEKFIKHYGW